MQQWRVDDEGSQHRYAGQRNITVCNSGATWATSGLCCTRPSPRTAKGCLLYRTRIRAVSAHVTPRRLVRPLVIVT
jgi:hypothetical protein